jgi:hypothetical protein
MCGSRGEAFAEDGCNGGGGGLDSTVPIEKGFDGIGNDDGICDPAEFAAGGCSAATVAIVKPKGFNVLGGLDVFRRYGSDLRPTTGTDCNGSDPDPAICGAEGVVVFCDPTVTGAATTDGDGFVHDNCTSNPGGDGVYGTGDDGTIYYREALENGLRSFTRENRAHAFSFINGIGVNHPDLCGELTTVDIDTDGNGTKETQGVTTPCGDSPSTGTRQVMYQNIQDLGATLSCFNCSALSQHTVPSHGFDTYTFKWTPLPGVHIPEDHPNTNGTIPEGGGTPSNDF